MVVAAVRASEPDIQISPRLGVTSHGSQLSKWQWFIFCARWRWQLPRWPSTCLEPTRKSFGRATRSRVSKTHACIGACMVHGAILMRPHATLLPSRSQCQFVEELRYGDAVRVRRSRAAGGAGCSAGLCMGTKLHARHHAWAQPGGICQALKAFQATDPPMRPPSLVHRYYTGPFCHPPEGIHRTKNMANPGTLLEGLRIENSPYNFSVRVRRWRGRKQAQAWLQWGRCRGEVHGALACTAAGKTRLWSCL